MDGIHFAPHGNHGKPLFVGIYRRIIIPGLLRWCEMDVVHPLQFPCHQKDHCSAMSSACLGFSMFPRTPQMAVAQKNPLPKWNPGKWKHGPTPAVCPSCLILSHTQIILEAKRSTKCRPCFEFGGLCLASYGWSERRVFSITRWQRFTGLVTPHNIYIYTHIYVYIYIYILHPCKPLGRVGTTCRRVVATLKTNHAIPRRTSSSCRHQELRQSQSCVFLGQFAVAWVWVKKKGNQNGTLVNGNTN